MARELSKIGANLVHYGYTICSGVCDSNNKFVIHKSDSIFNLSIKS